MATVEEIAPVTTATAPHVDPILPPMIPTDTTSPASSSEVVATTAFAAQLQALLTSNLPPFYNKNYAADTGPLGGQNIMRELADASFMNGDMHVSSSSDGHKETVWDALKKAVVVSPVYYQQAQVALKSEDFQAAAATEVLDDGSVGVEVPWDLSGPVELCRFSVEKVPLGAAAAGEFGAKGFFDWVPWPGKAKKKAPVVAKKTWYPSKTKVSLHAYWWGFELWLPHSVLLAIDTPASKSINIVAQIARVLTFIATNLPTTSLVPLIAFTVLKGLAPVIGYIATFMGYAWNAIKGTDNGQGVCLAATWLCPVALVPRAWDAPDPPAVVDPNAPPATPTPAPADGTNPAPAAPAPTEPPVAAPDAPPPGAAPVVQQSLAEGAETADGEGEGEGESSLQRTPTKKKAGRKGGEAILSPNKIKTAFKWKRASAAV